MFEVETTDELISWTPPVEPQFIGSGILYRGTSMFLYGRFGTFKSLLAMDMANKISSGQDWLIFPTTKAKVMVVNVEIPKFLYRSRLEKYITSNPPPAGSSVLWVTEHMFKLDQAKPLSDLINAVAANTPDVLIIDPWYKTLSGDISDATGVQKILDKLDEIKKKYNLAIVLVGHARKPHAEGVSDWGLELMGSSNVQNWADTSVAIEALTGKSICLHFTKARNATAELDNLEVVLDRSTLRFIV